MKLTSPSTIVGIVILGVVAGGGIGFLCGRLGSGASATGNSDAGKEPGYAQFRPSSANRQSAAAQRPDGSHDIKGSSAITEKLNRLDAIMEGENALDRNRALVAFIDQLAPGEFEEVITHFRSLGMTGKRLGEYSLLLTGWAKVDPDAALTFANTKIGSTFATNTILAALAATDPEAAIRWAQANHIGDSANPYLAGIIRSLSQSDPTRATALLSTMPFGYEREKALNALLPNYIAKGSAATRAWLATLPEGSLRTNATMSAAEKFAESDPKATADWLLATNSEATAHSLDNVLGTWALMDTAAALAYYESLPAGKDRVNALRGIISAVATQDPNSAADLLNRYSSDVTNNTVEGFVKHSMDTDPTMAMDYISQISNPKTQDQLYKKSLDSWLVSDPTAAQAWMQENTLPPKVLKHYQQGVVKVKK